MAISNGDQNDSTIDSNNSKDFNARLVVRPFDKCYDWLHGLQFGASYGVGMEGLPSGGTVAVSPSTLTTPSTFEWFAYNSGVAADGVRTRLSPELEYFHGSFGFATQYFVENQRLQAGELPLKPLFTVHTTASTSCSVTCSLAKSGTTTRSRSTRSALSCRIPVATPGAWEILWRVSRLDMGPNADLDADDRFLQ